MIVSFLGLLDPQSSALTLSPATTVSHLYLIGVDDIFVSVEF